jgi:two-component system, chemotaxis family, chemotaxis protein CheY
MDFPKKKFLVVDDSKMTCDFIVGAFRQLGAAHIDRAETADEALRMLLGSLEENKPYDLVTLDWEMPGMTGIELLRKIREDSRLKDLVVVMVSAKCDVEHLVQMAPLQPDGYIVKPFEADLLKGRVTALLKEGSAA